MLKIGAAPGCKGCNTDISSHSKECIERFERAFGKADEAGDVVEPAPVEALQDESLPTIDDALISDRFGVSPSPSIREELSDEDIPECLPDSNDENEEPPDACAFLSRECVHGIFTETCGQGGMSGSLGAAGKPQDDTNKGARQ